MTNRNSHGHGTKKHVHNRPKSSAAKRTNKEKARLRTTDQKSPRELLLEKVA